MLKASVCLFGANIEINHPRLFKWNKKDTFVSSELIRINLFRGNQLPFKIKPFSRKGWPKWKSVLKKFSKRKKDVVRHNPENTTC